VFESSDELCFALVVLKPHGLSLENNSKILHLIISAIILNISFLFGFFTSV
jgi:hypothetical protein